MSKPLLFYLLGDPSFGDHGANIHPLSSLVSDQLFTPCFATLPGDTPHFMLHVYKDDITTSATLSDTVILTAPTVGNKKGNLMLVSKNQTCLNDKMAQLSQKEVCIF
jgi:hypothetical protein